MDMHKIMVARMKELKENKENSLKEISLSSLQENPYQPRIEIKPEEIKDLANSYKKEGTITANLSCKIR